MINHHETTNSGEWFWNFFPRIETSKSKDRTVKNRLILHSEPRVLYSCDEFSWHHLGSSDIFFPSREFTILLMEEIRRSPVYMVNIPLFAGFHTSKRWLAGFLPSTVFTYTAGAFQSMNFLASLVGFMSWFPRMEQFFHSQTRMLRMYGLICLLRLKMATWTRANVGMSYFLHGPLEEHLGMSSSWLFYTIVHFFGWFCAWIRPWHLQISQSQYIPICNVIIQASFTSWSASLWYAIDLCSTSLQESLAAQIFLGIAQMDEFKSYRFGGICQFCF